MTIKRMHMGGINGGVEQATFIRFFNTFHFGVVHSVGRMMRRQGRREHRDLEKLNRWRFHNEHSIMSKGRAEERAARHTQTVLPTHTQTHLRVHPYAPNVKSDSTKQLGADGCGR